MLPSLILMLIAAPQQNCANTTTQTEMTRCAVREYQRADAAMNAQWRVTNAAMKRRDAQDTSRGGGFGYAGSLLESQRAWLKFRDTQCVVEGGQYAGGSMQPMVQTQCRTRLTNARTDQLKTLIRSR